MANVTFDASDFIKKSTQFTKSMGQAANRVVNAIADEILRISKFVVPHDTGQLQNSGHVEKGRDENQAIVGYNKVYAARLHEHPEYRFQKGRQGKYLENPIKNNLNLFKSIVSMEVGKETTK